MKLWESSYPKLIPDIYVSINNKIYKLHKLILYISPFLQNLIEENFIESRQEIIYLEIEQSGWEIFLNKIYGFYLLYIEAINEIDTIYEVNLEY